MRSKVTYLLINLRRKLSVERFNSVDYTRYMPDETEIKSRTSSGENLRRQSRHVKLHHSRSDDRRRSFDKHPKDPQSSRHSLNTQAMMEGCSGCEFEPKYFTTVSLDTEESRADNSDESHAIDIEDANPASSEGPTEADMLLEEPELENVTEMESSTDDHCDDDEKCESHGSTSERTDTATLRRQIIITMDVNSRASFHEKAAESSASTSARINDEKRETTLYIEEDDDDDDEL